MIKPTWHRHFRLPPFAKNAKDGAPHCGGDASEIKSLGHPPTVPDFKDMEVMGKYNEQLQKAGVLLALDGLTPPPTMSARVTFKSGKSKVTDGPFTEAKEVVGGYWIIQVKSREEALELGLAHPRKGYRNGGSSRCACYLILLWTRDQTHLAPAFPTPALRKQREGTGHPLCW